MSTARPAIHISEDKIEPLGQRIEQLGKFVLRYSVVLVLIWIGAMKFTSYEAQGIQPLVQTSPLMAWIYRFLSVQALSNVLGVIEISLGLLIALRPVSAKRALWEADWR